MTMTVALASTLGPNLSMSLFVSGVASSILCDVLKDVSGCGTECSSGGPPVCPNWPPGDCL